MANAIILPSFNELQNLKILIPALLTTLDANDLILICDDSEDNQKLEISKYASKFEQVRYLPGGFKSGRGKAVRRGMNWVLENQPKNITHILEADCDGSHRVEDILLLLNSNHDDALVIGSRYLPQSQIIGWPRTRRGFSKFLNLVIPRLVNVDVKDITNGLRRYSIDACKFMTEGKHHSDGFIYLSEQLMVLKNAGIQAREIPILFEPRMFGDSSVGLAELLNSVFEIFKLFCRKNRLK